jgi:hypothetical protein
MPTYAFTRTLEQIRTGVLRKLRVLAPGEPVPSEHVEIIDEALNMRLKELHAMGKLWWQISNATTDLTLSSGVATVAIPTDMLYPVTLAVRVGTEDYPVQIVSHMEWHAIQNKSQSGEPSRAIVEGSNFRFHPVPQQAYTGKLTYQAIAADVEANTAPDVPVSMMRSLVTLVASDCADAFGVKEQRIGRLLAEAQQAERVLLALNNERVDTTTVEFVDY